ncbi:hexaprenyldihydroxybenzoate methyltransferase mitochondrial precursor [Parathielavia hyrcaniae]|uniref:Ubiquinone biosynthesis O-methyltransferase, mitochondrial n=1 Tax=Parathielavia hyrcaniae TaxID=113614 RepID=A0AAN6Q7P8_9PEZI|nr:hexaprenyldihydroxybenzoate methyltransferase mitochondrial precursor [Parathielavia hyrcaniae]
MRPSLRHVTKSLRPARLSCRTSAAATQAIPDLQPSHHPSTRKLSTTPTRQHTPSSSSSVNETEVSHFSALASSWWDPYGPSKPLHLMNPLRHDFIQTCLSSSNPPQKTTNLRYLDVGCGGGIFAESAARLPSTASVTAIDPSPAILAVARAHARRDPSLVCGGGGSGKLVYLNETIESLALPEEAAPGEEEQRYDVVSLFEVVEHVDYPAAFLDRVGEFVRPGGWLVLSTIARTWTSWVTTNLVAEDILGVVPKGTHDWAKYVNEAELREYFAQKGGMWGTPTVRGVVYVPGLGWREVRGSEKVGNYFFGVQRVG